MDPPGDKPSFDSSRICSFRTYPVEFLDGFVFSFEGIFVSAPVFPFHKMQYLNFISFVIYLLRKRRAFFSVLLCKP